MKKMFFDLFIFDTTDILLIFFIRRPFFFFIKSPACFLNGLPIRVKLFVFLVVYVFLRLLFCFLCKFFWVFNTKNNARDIWY